jgi:cardiolipin synthase
MLEKDLERCRQVSLEEFDHKPGWFPLGMAVARLFSPVL